MIKIISYNIRFPFGGTFKKPIQYILLSRIYKELQNSICYNLTNDCNHCNEYENCLFYKVSGENFNKYPGILVIKNIVEVQNFKKNDYVKVSFGLIGNNKIYENFIDALFKDLKNIGNIYFQKTRVSIEVLNDDELYTGKAIFKTPIDLETDINEILNYYNNNYDTAFKSDVVIKKLNLKRVYDQSNYFICGKRYRLKGETGIVFVERMPKALMRIGVGKTNVLGGGFLCELE